MLATVHLKGRRGRAPLGQKCQVRTGGGSGYEQSGTQSGLLRCGRLWACYLGLYVGRCPVALRAQE